MPHGLIGTAPSYVVLSDSEGPGGGRRKIGSAAHHPPARSFALAQDDSWKVCGNDSANEVVAS